MPLKPTFRMNILFLVFTCFVSANVYSKPKSSEIASSGRGKNTEARPHKRSKSKEKKDKPAVEKASKRKSSRKALKKDKKSAKKPEEKKKIRKPSAMSRKLKDKLSLGLSFGFVDVKQKGDSWRASGASDVLVSYNSSFRALGKPLWLTFRYLPVDVAVKEKRAVGSDEYYGVVHFGLLGGSLVFPMAKLDLRASVELGGGGFYSDKRLGAAQAGGARGERRCSGEESVHNDIHERSKIEQNKLFKFTTLAPTVYGCV